MFASHVKMRGEQSEESGMNNPASNIGAVTSRQAWQFAMVPVEIKGDELHFLSTAKFAPRAMRFVRHVLRMRPCVRLVNEIALRDRLIQEFDMGGLMPLGMSPGVARWKPKKISDNGSSRI